MNPNIWRDVNWKISVNVNMGVNLLAIKGIVVEKLNFSVWHVANLYAAGIDMKSNPSVLAVSGIMV